MSDERQERQELNRRISELKEPKPEYGPAGAEYLGESRPIGYDRKTYRPWTWLISPGEGWEWHFTNLRWMPLDWCGSEEASAVLLEEMPYPRIVKRLDEKWIVILRECSGEADTDRKTAIAKAWLAWKQSGGR